ncbi:hypothetical protein Rsub_08010 [Raphidocelis subcapitata]|uniref:Topoisomerase 6 subunit A/Spo11 TOPRIM domain-containing protein n=1 Tax=Raphidocelis subcapitata TaxID=307507 RepID=A0A2V0P4P8_9CHLO|nr:hypothetical protein Rsub_08010 [Raphidocelis subcapitata]|eukprot:GBF94838.1 hypothetical protein Rsub_08010 [Raphidocelis subcapitata]
MDDFDDLLGADGSPAPPMQAAALWPPAAARGGAGFGAAGRRAAPRRERGAVATTTPAVADPWAVLAGLGDGMVGCSDDEGSGDERGTSGARGSEGDGDGDHGTGSRRRRGSGGGSSGHDSDDASSSGAGEDIGSDDLVEADFDLDRSAVLSRIECFISDQVDAIARGQLPELELVSRAEGNTHMVAEGGAAAGPSDDEGTGNGGSSGEEEGASSGDDKDEAGAPPGGAQTWMAGDASDGEGGREPRARTRRRRRRGSQPRRAARLVSPSLFPSVAVVNGAIQDAVALLRVPRSRLGIVCSSRGAAAGLLHIRDGPGGAWVDCGALGMAGWSIPGDIAAVERLSFRVSARYVLVVEKDAIFQRLAGDRLHERLPLVMVTAKGNPDLATRAFLSRLCAAAPSLPVLGLVDWNPAGASILATFKFGNPRMGLEGSRYALPRLRWLGVVSGMLDAVPASAFHRLTPRDAALMAGLRRRLAGHPAWLQELAAMEERGLKCDTEALYSNGGFEGLHTLLARRILRGQYL